MLIVVVHLQAISNTVCAIIVLENISIRQAIRIFYDMRRQALDDLLSTFDPSASNFADFLTEVAKLIHMTVRQAWGVFGAQDGARSLLEETLAKLADPSISSVGQQGSLRNTGAEDLQSTWLSGLFSERTNIHIMIRHLPPGLREQTVTVGVPSTGSLDEVEQEAVAWVRDITRTAKAGISNVLQNTSSGQRLWTIREKVVFEVSREESMAGKHGSKTRQTLGVASDESLGPGAQVAWPEVKSYLDLRLVPVG